MVKLCTDVGAELATREETHAWLDNFGHLPELKYGLTSTMNGSQHWFTENMEDYGWSAGCCRDRDRFFFCAKSAGIASKLQLFLFSKTHFT